MLRRPVVLLLGLSLLGCSDSAAPDLDKQPGADGRPYLMGWAPISPRPETELLLQTIDSMALVSEIAIVQQGVPWAPLLDGASADSLVEDRAGLTDFLRAKGMQVVFLVDPLDGLDRTQEDPGLTALGRSILESEIRGIHEDWVRRIADRIRPRYFGLASEINTLAALGDPALNAEITDLVNTLAPQIRELSPRTDVFVSFQADQANGVLGSLGGIDHLELIDDYDIDVLGLSSYPVFAFDSPAQIPDDYFTAFAEATDLPLIFVEGGWSSEDVPWSPGSSEDQVAFLRRYEELFDGVDMRTWIMLTFTDLDIDNFGLDPERAEGLSNFSRMGILDIALQRKPAYAEWARIFARERR